MKTKDTIVSALFILALAHVPIASNAASLLIPGEKSSIYYKIGGGEPISGAANPTTTTVKIGLGGTARLNYSCGKFDASVTIQNLLNNFAQLGTQVSSAIQAGIAGLPLYILQRASPGLYDLFQTYQKKAETEFNIGLKTCEQIEETIRKGGDPYEEWIKIAKGEDWKNISLTTTDVVAAKKTVDSKVGDAGITWIGGVSKGGFAQPAIEVIRDLTYAGYNTTINKPPATNPATVNQPSTKITEAFPNAIAAGDWAVSVIGDQQIASCDHPGCPAKAATPGSGLLPKFETERPLSLTQLNAAIAGRTSPKRADLEAASAPGVAITRELVDAIRALRPVEQEIVLSRLSMEIAQARTIDRALMIRNTIITGSGVPEAGWEPAQREARARVEQLNRYIDDLLFETRVRREVVSATANTLIESFRSDRLQSLGTQTRERSDSRPLDGGRVQ